MANLVMVPLDMVHDAYNRQVLQGPLRILMELIDKEHFVALKDIAPLVQESLSGFDVPIGVSVPEPVAVSTALIDTINRLVSEVSQLHTLLVSLLPPQPVPMGPEPTVPQAPTPV